ncbi:MAG: hypothetical protein LBG17_10055 [Bacteroidales bacterium]|jgi:hypothetical protein|nr:hypothetical protein [Bacteroidales bacterium]
MYYIAAIFNQRNQYDSAFYYMTKMFDNDCGYFLHSISDYSTDNLFKNYVDTSTVLNGLIKRHYNKLDTSINRSFFDTSFQIFYLQSMEKLLPSYRINISNYAYLFDRVRVNQSNPQVFGTQFGLKDEIISSDSSFSAYFDYGYALHPLEQPDLTDFYRAVCLMGPLSDYIKYHRQRVSDDKKIAE